ncbi:hypothetical protein BKA65DRAFT_533721 [Rhexocercosporidium sp. MPI-PUGE-AT-0058]|nr:hypothetical protein BKA65DRAFT_533721 [Rhexocercosporidium sp. MPI-PUGE-AT-0058]
MMGQKVNMENSSNGANVSFSKPCSNRPNLQPEAASGEIILSSVTTCASKSSSTIHGLPDNKGVLARSYIDFPSNPILTNSQGLSNLTSKQPATFSEPNKSNFTIQSTRPKASLEICPTSRETLSSPPSPSTLAGFSDVPGSVDAEFNTAPSVRTDFNPYRMDRFINELPEFWCTGQGGRASSNIAAMKARLDALLARVE